VVILDVALEQAKSAFDLIAPDIRTFRVYLRFRIASEHFNI
jgi:hypothetical protein